MSLRKAIIRELRASPIPATTVALALVCGRGFRRPLAVTLTALVAFERAGVVRRLAPVPLGGRGRPTVRWVLNTRGDLCWAG